MRTPRLAIPLLMLVALLLPGVAAAQHKGEPGVFDYYVLSLSWAPAHCARPEAAGDVDQCGPGRDFGFVVHGLWPQYDQGGYPRACSRQRSVPKAVLDDAMVVMPSAGLVIHEWETHGTCSGQEPAKYFATLRTAAARVTVPESVRAPKPGLSVPADQVQTAFTQANPGLTPDMVAVVCARRQVTEVRVCLDRDLKFRTCGKTVTDRCGTTGLLKGP